MPRAYLRLDPAFDERKESYPDGPYAALVATFCLAELQPQRGRFRSLDYLSRMLGKRGRHARYLVEQGDLTILPDGRVYVDGWDEWQEGDWKVSERVARIRDRDKKSGAQRSADWRLRTKIFTRDNYTCRYCGVADYPRDWLVLEHVMPVSRGGPTDEDNLVTACRSCNHKKGNKTPDEAGMPLRDPSPVQRDETRDASRDTALRHETAVAVGGGGSGAVAATDPVVAYMKLTGQGRPHPKVEERIRVNASRYGHDEWLFAVNQARDLYGSRNDIKNAETVAEERLVSAQAEAKRRKAEELAASRITPEEAEAKRKAVQATIAAGMRKAS